MQLSFQMFKHLLTLFGLIALSACQQENEINAVLIEPHCLPSQSKCFITTDRDNLSVLFNVERVVAEQMFNIVVRNVTGKEKVVIDAHLEGRDMFMGKIPLFFNEKNNGDYVSDVMLGSCADPKMVWRLFLTVSYLNNSNDSPENSDMKTNNYIIDFESSRS